MTRVLIVDDSPTEVVFLEKLLLRHGYEVIKAQNGADGVALCRAEKPDAVFMDIMMPELNGFQATRQIKYDKATQSIPVIIVTTQDRETDRIWGELQGAKGFLTKPVDESQLIQMLDHVLAV